MKAPLTVAVMGLLGCAAGPVREYEPGPSPAGPVILVHGLWPDNDRWWTVKVEEALQQQGIDAIPVSYSSFVLGYLFGFGTDRPADRLTSFVKELEMRHAACGCPAPLRFRAIGYSAGTVVLRKAAERGVSFERVYLAGSSLPFWTRPPEQLGTVVNYYSLLDGVVGVALGGGQWGLSNADENRRHWHIHLWPLWFDRDEVDRIIAELRRHSEGPEHICFQIPEFREWYRGAKALLRRGE